MSAARSTEVPPEEPRAGRRLLKWCLALVVAGGVAWLFWDQISSSAETLPRLTVANYRAVARADGRVAPGFVLPEVGSDRTISLSELRGKVVVLNMWATWCAPCRLEAVSLESAWRKYKNKGVAFLGVNERDQEALASSFQDEFDLTYPSAFDPSGRVGFLYEITGMPETFIITRDGRIMYRFIGYLEGSVLESAIEDALRGG